MSTFWQGLFEFNEDHLSLWWRMQRVVAVIQPDHVLHVQLYHLRHGVRVETSEQQTVSVFWGRPSHTQLSVM